MLSTEIRYFLAVASTGSLSAASQQLYVAVSAISRQIQRLEQQVGAPLFERHPRGMILNEAGEIFAHHVRRNMLEMELAVAEIKGLNAVRRALIRIACTDGVAFDLLPMLMARFRLQNPAVTFSLQIASSSTVAALIREGECDVAFQFSLQPERAVDVVASWPAPVLLAMQQQHPLAGVAIGLADLSHYPVALPQQGSTVRQLFDLSCHMNGIFIEPVLTCDSFATLWHFLLNTPGALTLCSQFTVLYQTDRLALKSIGINQLSQRTLQIQTPTGRRGSAALALWLDFVCEEITQQDQRVQPMWQDA